MSKISSKIGKLLKALQMQNKIYLFTKEQIYSQKLNKVCVMKKLTHLIPVGEYYKLHPEKKRKKDDNREYVKVPVAESFKEIDILLELVDIYKAGDSSG